MSDAQKSTHDLEESLWKFRRVTTADEMVWALTGKLAAQDAEIARLREALENIIKHMEQLSPDAARVSGVVAIARAALEVSDE